jgi:hypothetical protein
MIIVGSFQSNGSHLLSYRKELLVEHIYPTIGQSKGLRSQDLRFAPNCRFCPVARVLCRNLSGISGCLEREYMCICACKRASERGNNYLTSDLEPHCHIGDKSHAAWAKAPK